MEMAGTSDMLLFLNYLQITQKSVSKVSVKKDNISVLLYKISIPQSGTLQNVIVHKFYNTLWKRASLLFISDINCTFGVSAITGRGLNIEYPKPIVSSSHKLHVLVIWFSLLGRFVSGKYTNYINWFTSVNYVNFENGFEGFELMVPGQPHFPAIFKFSFGKCPRWYMIRKVL